MGWFRCPREMSRSPMSPNAVHKPHTGLVLPPHLWLGLCPTPLHGSRHLPHSHPYTWHRQSKPSCEGMCQQPAENYCSDMLSPFFFTWFSVDRAFSSWGRSALVREDCSSQLSHSKVKAAWCHKTYTVKVSATDLASRAMPSHSTPCTMGTQDLWFPASPANPTQKTSTISQDISIRFLAEPVLNFGGHRDMVWTRNCRWSKCWWNAFSGGGT